MKISTEDIESFKKAWLNTEEISSIIESEKDIENWNTYDYEEAFKIVKQNLLSKQEKEYV